VFFATIFTIFIAFSFIILNLVLEKPISALSARDYGIIGGLEVIEKGVEFKSGKPIIPQQAQIENQNKKSDISQENAGLAISEKENSGQPENFLGYYISNQDTLNNQNSPLTSIRQERSGILIYKVQRGDTLSTIAADFGISHSSITWANNIKTSHLSPGQEIVILPTSGVKHEIKIGDSIESIAEYYSGDPQRIIEFNNLKNPTLKPGETLIIPDGKMPQAQRALAQTKATASTLPSFPNYYSIPTTGINWGILHTNNAIDIANRCGTTVIASTEGLITNISIGWNSGYGNYVEIQHPNGTETLYAHLNKIDVKEGEYVSDGDPIGLMGDSGYSTGCHLHFEVHGAKNPFAK
jgi:murein DD-endopeptidase MepM/ murein hydrolase activator NlpD